MNSASQKFRLKNPVSILYLGIQLVFAAILLMLGVSTLHFIEGFKAAYEFIVHFNFPYLLIKPHYFGTQGFSIFHWIFAGSQLAAFIGFLASASSTKLKIPGNILGILGLLVWLLLLIFLWLIAGLRH